MVECGRVHCLPTTMPIVVFFLLLAMLASHSPVAVVDALLQQQHTQRQSSIFERVKAPVCRPIEIPLCRDIPYNRTILPNPFIDGLDPQSIHSQTEHFKPLIRTKCSPHLLFFICSAFAPMCPEQLPQAVTSCRSVCEEVQQDCIKIFREFDFPWPPALNCSRFPTPPELCMRPEPTAQSPLLHDRGPATPTTRELPECPQDLVDMDPQDPQAKCAFRCEKMTMFRKDLKEQARLWLLMCAFLNVCVAAFTVSSFWIDRNRFAFPERSICFLALCSLLSSLPHLLRPLIGFDSMACGQMASGARYLLLEVSLSGESATGNLPMPCLASFLLHFAFSLAASMWWLTLTFTWYLSAARKWAEEAIERRSLQLHALAWGVPALLAACALFTQRVDASELSGLCAVGNANPQALLWLWTVPRLVATLGGLYLILAGFSAMCKERNSFRRRGTDTSKLEKFMCKMALFTTLYVLPSLVATLCELHQLHVLVQWVPHTFNCKRQGGAFSGECIRPEQPPGMLHVLGATMVLTAGMASGVWMLSPKTLNSWKRVLACCGCCDRRGDGATAKCALGAAAEWRECDGAGRQFAPLSCSSTAAAGFHHQQHHRQHNRRPSSSLLLAASSPRRPLLPRGEPPSLPPPPPTAVPSSYNGGGHYPPLSLSSMGDGHQQQHYIPLSVMASGVGHRQGSGHNESTQSGF